MHGDKQEGYLVEVHEEIFESYLERFQEEIINSGGRFFRRAELKEMSVGQLMDICARNRIEVACNHVPAHIEPIDEKLIDAQETLHKGIAN